MKTSHTILITVLTVFAIFGFTESSNERTVSSREIEVTGSSEMIIQPNEIEFEIRIVPFDGKKIEKSEEVFFSVLEEHGIEKENVQFKGLDYYHYWYYWWNRKDYEYKTYTFTLSENIDIFDFVEELNPKWVSHLRVTKTTHDKIQEYRKQVKIDAMKAAKEKASYLLNSVDQDLGSLIEVIEINTQANMNYYWWNQPNMVSNSVSNYTSFQGGSSQSNSEIDGIQPIKLRYEIKTKFEII